MGVGVGRGGWMELRVDITLDIGASKSVVLSFSSGWGLVGVCWGGGGVKDDTTLIGVYSVCFHRW